MNCKKKINNILVDKKIILATIGLSCLVILAFIFRWPQETQGSFGSIGPADEFVIQSAEETVQPVLSEKEKTVEVATDENPNMADCKFFDIYSTSSSDLAVRKIKVPILMYHYIEATPAETDLPNLFHNTEVFEAQLKTMKNACYETVLVREVGEAITSGGVLPAKPLAITFDDGYADMYYNAFPLLKKYGMKGTMYVIVEALDKPGYLTSAQAKEMAESGYVEIASHTLNHVNLFKTSYQRAVVELTESKLRLEKVIGQPVEDFAYPYGYFTERDENICHQAGYLTCASTYPGDQQSLGKRYSLYRLRPGYRIGQSLIDFLETAGPKR